MRGGGFVSSKAATLARSTASRIGDPTRGGSFAARARHARWVLFHDRFPELADLRVLDLGGTRSSWEWIWPAPRLVTCVNLDPRLESGLSGRVPVEVVLGDACSPPAHLLSAGYDLVVSNSVIEHVGGPAARRRFADTVASAAPEHWIQTPARCFPLEPHWLFPGFQWLPVPVRAWLSPRWPIASQAFRGRDRDGALDDVLAVDLLSDRELHRLFPDSQHLRETVLGMTKSRIVSSR